MKLYDFSKMTQAQRARAMAVDRRFSTTLPKRAKCPGTMAFCRWAMTAEGRARIAAYEAEMDAIVAGA